jgi:glycosidase
MWMDIRGCQDTNGDGIGDLQGLISRLDHFQDAGIGAFIFAGLQPSDFSYVGTMMTEFCDVDPRYGTLADFDRLLKEAHKRQIAILLGWSPYSTHPDHPYFAASRDPAHPDHGEFKDFYVWAGDINARQPRGSGHWEWDPVRRAYYHTIWYSADHRWCPQMNPMSDRVRKENERVIRFWLDRGADGFWVDVGAGGSFFNWEDHRAFSREMTDLVHSYPGKWIISEGSKSMGDALGRDGYDSFFNNWARNLSLHKTVFRPPGKGRFVEFFENRETQGIHEALLSFYDDPKGNQVINWFRTKTPVDFDSWEDVQRLKLQFLLHATLPLIPLFGFPQYCGLGRKKPREFVTPYPFIMMWDDSPNYGFTDGVPFISQNEEDYPISATVSGQLSNPDSPLSHFKRIMNLRRAHPALQCHDTVLDSYGRIPTDDDDNCFACLRRHTSSGECILLAVNLVNQPRSHRLKWDESAHLRAFLGGSRVFRRLDGDGPESISWDGSGAVELLLPGYGYIVASS